MNFQYFKKNFPFILLLISSVFDASQGDRIANVYFLGKEKFLLEILHGVEDPLMNREWLSIGRSLVLNESNYLTFTPEMRDFYGLYRNGTLLSTTQPFNPFDMDHYREAVGLFHFLYNTNDWETLRTNTCWARIHVNPDLFVFVVSQAILKRIDFKGLILPKIYEIQPQYFLSAWDVRTVESFDYSQWNRLGMLYENPMQSVQASWQHQPFPQRIDGLRGTAKWVQAMADVTGLWYPAQTRRKHHNSLGYLLEDISWNAYWYYQNMGLWWTEVGDSNGQFPHWEVWFGMLRQILARYKLEVYANESRNHGNPDSLLRHGMKFRLPKDSQRTAISEALSLLMELVTKVTSDRSFQLSTGKVLLPNRPEDWTVLLNTLFGQNLYEFFRRYLGLNTAHLESPQRLQYFETQLQDRQFYYHANFLLHTYQRLRRNFQSYDMTQLKQPNISIDSVIIGPLETYFEAVDFDVSNLLHNRHFYYDGQLLWQKTLQVRQQRLQHARYSIQLNISSQVPQAIVLRTFLAPVNAGLTPDAYFQIDNYIVNLVAGSNMIRRSSSDFFGTKSTSSHLSYTELYRYVLLALDDQYDFPLNISNSNCAFPQRLVLPRGGLNGQGLPVKFLFIATPYAYRYHKAPNMQCDFTDGIQRFDELPDGFPFDYEHDEVGAFSGGNIYWKRAEIYHRN